MIEEKVNMHDTFMRDQSGGYVMETTWNSTAIIVPSNPDVPMHYKTTLQDSEERPIVDALPLLCYTAEGRSLPDCYVIASTTNTSLVSCPNCIEWMHA